MGWGGGKGMPLLAEDAWYGGGTHILLRVAGSLLVLVQEFTPLRHSLDTHPNNPPSTHTHTHTHTHTRARTHTTTTTLHTQSLSPPPRPPLLYSSSPSCFNATALLSFSLRLPSDKHASGSHRTKSQLRKQKATNNYGHR